MTDTFRALCAEVIFVWSRSTNPDDLHENMIPLVDRARAALAQPEPVPTDEELDGVMFQAVWECMDNADDLTNDEMDRLKARAVLARWGTPANDTREEHANYD
jgi:hypothetical protein